MAVKRPVIATNRRTGYDDSRTAGAARKGYAAHARPAKQGGLWYVAEEMKILEPA